MPENLAPTETLTLGGKERTLRMDLNALIDFERVTGKSIMDGGLSVESLSFADIRGMLWACMVQDDESLTEREVGSFLHPGNIGEVSSLLTKLTGTALPDGQDDGLPLAQESPANSTG